MATTEELPRKHRLTVHDYGRMSQAGILHADAHVELIDGEVIDMAPSGSRHAGTVMQLMHVLMRAVGERAFVRGQDGVRLGRFSEPEPDIALLRPRADFYKSAHPGPGDVLLMVEVADTSLAYDRDVKMPLYAKHGIPEMWIVDLASSRLIRFSRPRSVGYAASDEPDLQEPIGLLALPQVRLDLSGLFAA